MKLGRLFVVAGLALAAAPPALAQSIAEAGVAVGVMVYGPQGNEVGPVENIQGDVVVINTGGNSAALAGSSFVKGPKGPVIGYTQEQLDEAVEGAKRAAQAKLDAALVPGAALRSSDGVAVGTIKALNEDGTILIEGTSQTFALARDAFAADETGPILRITAQQLTDALGKSAAPAEPG
jgi:hypothetical protein